MRTKLGGRDPRDNQGADGTPGGAEAHTCPLVLARRKELASDHRMHRPPHLLALHGPMTQRSSRHSNALASASAAAYTPEPSLLYRFAFLHTNRTSLANRITLWPYLPAPKYARNRCMYIQVTRRQTRGGGLRRRERRDGCSLVAAGLSGWTTVVYTG